MHWHIIFVPCGCIRVAVYFILVRICGVKKWKWGLGLIMLFRLHFNCLKFCSELKIRQICQFYRRFHTEERGGLYSENYRIFFKNEHGNFISPYHDIPLISNATNKTYNMVVEIPRWTNAKMEIDTKKPLNPIRQDLQNGNPRFAPNIFPYNGYIWNYGAFPQTWEHPKHVDALTKFKGDNDPLDVCEIGSKVLQRGQVISVKVLGVLGMIDQGEMDWKVIVLNREDDHYNQIKNLNDVERFKFGYLDATREWFRNYKIPNNKPANTFAFEEVYQNSDFAENLLNETHTFWEKLVHNKCSHNLDVTNTTLSKTPYVISQKEAASIVDVTDPLEIPNKILGDTTWHFLN